MKKRIGLSIVVIFSTIFIFISCSKNSDSKQQVNTNPAISLTEAEISQIGSEHNRLCKLIVDEIIDNNTDLFVSINKTLMNNSYPSISKQELEFLTLSKIDKTKDSIISNMSNKTQRDILKKMFKISESTSLEYIIVELSKLHKNTKETLINSEKNSTLIAIEVAMNSAKLWMPVSKGGDGYFDKLLVRNSFIQRTTQTSDSSKPTPKTKDDSTIGNIVAMDALGAFTGFLSAALPYFSSGGPANPISNGYLAGRTILGAVSGSVSAAVGSATKGSSTKN